ncbi:pyrroline-5-carboxylate reductase [bacterium]|nr:pyrroline-5-carboxylate reductase [bacterium]
MSKQIVFIGAGNATEAFLGGMLSDGLYRPEEILAVEINPARREHIGRQFGIALEEDIGPAIRGIPVVFLAVKPQNVTEALDLCAPHLSQDQLVISIVAGRPSDSIRERLGGHRRVVRVMPNLALQVRCAVTAIGVGPHTTAEDVAAARKILSTVGAVVEVEEGLLDAVTAVSGSGPGYVFLLMEALMEAALAQGLSADVARTLVVETFYGASCLIRKLGDEPAVLRRRVCSPGGTTLRGIGVFEDSNIFGIFRQAVEAAARRSAELGDEHR